MIISRYFTKEIINTLLAVTLVLLLIFLSNALIRFLSYAAAGKLGANILFRLMGFEIPYLLALLIPLGLYLGIILAYGRMYAESELRVLHACGLSIGKLTLITSMIASFVTIIVVILTLWINPWLSNQKEKLIANSLSPSNILDNLMPGRFQVSTDGRRVLYVEQVNKKRKQANNLFIADQKLKEPGNQVWTVVSATRGSQMQDPITRDRFMVASDGNRYEGIPGQNDFKIIQFEKYAVRLPQTTIISKRHEQEGIPTHVLVNHYEKPENAAELQWRFSIPLATFVLSLLAIPLSHVQPRRGRYSQLFPAILIYIVYVNLLFVARNWVEQKFIPIHIGMWWVHGLVLIGAILFLMLQSRWSIKRMLRGYS